VEKVAGIGGFFFRARDPGALKAWYERHLGIRRTPGDYDSPCWRQKAGTTVFEPFPAGTGYFGDPSKAWMINFRVADLGAMVRQLRSAGIRVTVDPRKYPNGRFARLRDPEGNPVALWQPQGRDAPRAAAKSRGGRAVRP
jgi:predicted enzyme related to lactoylglutathione lyase